MSGACALQARTSSPKGRRVEAQVTAPLYYLVPFSPAWGVVEPCRVQRGHRRNWSSLVSATCMWRGEHVGYLANQEPSPQDRMRLGMPREAPWGRETVPTSSASPSTGEKVCQPEVGVAGPVSVQHGSWGLLALGGSPRTGMLSEYLGGPGWVGRP